MESIEFLGRLIVDSQNVFNSVECRHLARQQVYKNDGTYKNISTKKFYFSVTKFFKCFLFMFFSLFFSWQEIDVKAGGGKTMTMGEMVKSFMLKLEWFDTRFPRIAVNVQVS